jgi:hypothetical protein
VTTAIVALLAVYLSGYFALSEATTFGPPHDRWVERKFSNRAVAFAYFPVAWAELQVRDLAEVSAKVKGDSLISVPVYSVRD